MVDGGSVTWLSFAVVSASLTTADRLIASPDIGMHIHTYTHTHIRKRTHHSLGFGRLAVWPASSLSFFVAFLFLIAQRLRVWVCTCSFESLIGNLISSGTFQACKDLWTFLAEATRSVDNNRGAQKLFAQETAKCRDPRGPHRSPGNLAHAQMRKPYQFLTWASNWHKSSTFDELK